MLEFCFILLILYLGVVLAVCLPYWYELGNTPCEDIPTLPVGPKRVLRLWFEMARDALLLGAAWILDPFVRQLEKPLQSADATLPPLLLVHGLYHNPTGWLYLRRRLRKAGFGKIHTAKYSSWRTSIHEATRTLDAAMADIENRYPGQKPVLVGHSLGGLLIRNWLADEVNQKRASGALTLGTPHQGSKMAALAFGALGRSLLPANTFFADLARRESPAQIPCVALASEADIMVLPQQCLVPVTPGWAIRLTPYATHVGLITKGAVLRMTVWELHRMIKEAGDLAAAAASVTETSAPEPEMPGLETFTPEQEAPAPELETMPEPESKTPLAPAESPAATIEDKAAPPENVADTLVSGQMPVKKGDSRKTTPKKGAAKRK